MEKKTLKISRKLLDARAGKEPFTWDVDEKSLGEGLHQLTCRTSGSLKLVLVETVELPETEKDINKMDKKDILKFTRAGIEAIRLASMGSALNAEIERRRVAVAIANDDVTVAQEILRDIEESLVPMLKRIGQEPTVEIKTSYVQNTYGIDYARIVEILGIED